MSVIEITSLKAQRGLWESQVYTAGLGPQQVAEFPGNIQKASRRHVVLPGTVSRGLAELPRCGEIWLLGDFLAE